MYYYQKGDNQVNSNDIYVSCNADVGNGAYYVLGVFFPILAIILKLRWKKTKPISSNQIMAGSITFMLQLIIFALCLVSKNNFIALFLLGGDIFLVYKMVRKVNKEKNEYISKLSLINNTKNQIYPLVSLNELKKNNHNLTLAIILLTCSKAIYIVVLLIIIVIYIVYELYSILAALAGLGLLILSFGTMGADILDDSRTDFLDNLVKSLNYGLFIVTVIISLVLLGLSIYYSRKYFKNKPAIININYQ